MDRDLLRGILYGLLFSLILWVPSILWLVNR